MVFTVYFTIESEVIEHWSVHYDIVKQKMFAMNYFFHSEMVWSQI